MATLEDYFSIQTFLIVLRETLESAIIISVLLSFVHQTFYPSHAATTSRNSADDPASAAYHAITVDSSKDTESDVEDAKLYKFLNLQIWIGGLLGLFVCLLVGSFILAVFYIIGSDLWAVSEKYWEGTFSIIASLIISVMGVEILRVSKMQQKWKAKLARLVQSSSFYPGSSNSSTTRTGTTWIDRIRLWTEKYNLLILPFVTTLREGLEAIVFVGGIGINENTSVWAIVNSALLAIMVGSVIGFILYRSGNSLSLQWFLIVSTCFLYLVAAGLFSKGVWNFELQQFIDACGGQDVSETGHGPGSYDIARSVWHVNCCNGEMQEDGAFWMIFTAIFGWTNSATYGSVISYTLYWVVVTCAFTALLYEEKHGYLPLIPIRWQLKRIRKRLSVYAPLPEDPELCRDIRQSIDSANSATPLQQQ
ncbi:uncharacterized protein LODBEIA_P01640 [Lodderomyces beijingensis]|uniref:Iron transporter FTH1 n=1 Tax=Lodderomyces beijingensis TaxID=1775926 RepID=A0ABP0ZHW6_9ASCO